MEFSALDAPTIIITNAEPVEICNGSSVMLTTSVTADPVVSYLWSPADGLSATNIANPTASPVASTTYTVTVTDGNGFTATDDITVTVNPLPSAPAAGNVTACFDNAPHTCSANVGADETVVWYDAATGGNIVSAPTGTAIGTYSAYAAAKTSSTGCESAARTIVTVTINAIPTANITGTSPICAGGTSLLNSNAAAGSGSIASYQWNLDGTPIPLAMTAY